MKQYEVKVYWENDNEDLEEALNTLGLKGWTIIHVESFNVGQLEKHELSRFILQREVGTAE